VKSVVHKDISREINGILMADDLLDKENAEAASYEDELTSRRTVTIPLREYDELKQEQHFIKDKALIDIIDNIERLIRALRKHIIRK
jgi:hypothetical protein|tara:strand:- start:119 stop:379 length:261 start_codon:yes stop_codon:yes gene_type:complete